MKYLFSEVDHNYTTYTYPYEVWCVLDEGEVPADALENGFLTASTELSLNKFYLCRSGRVDLSKFYIDRRAKQILNKAVQLRGSVLSSLSSDQYVEIQQLASQYFAHVQINPARRYRNFMAMLTSKFSTRIFVLYDANDSIVGALPILISRRSAELGILTYDRNLRGIHIGSILLTSAILAMKNEDLDYVYVGSCYTSNGLYKTRFMGFEFYNGRIWSNNREELKFLIDPTPENSGSLFQNYAYMEKFGDVH